MDPKLLEILVCPICKGPLLHRQPAQQIFIILPEQSDEARLGARRVGSEALTDERHWPP